MAKSATATGTAKSQSAEDANAGLRSRIEELELRERQRTTGVFTPDQVADKTRKLHSRELARRQMNGPHLWQIIKTIRIDSRDGKVSTKESRCDFWTELDGGTAPDKVVKAWWDCQEAQYLGDDNPYTAELIRENARPENFAEVLNS